MNYAALKNEIVTDPSTKGYAAPWNSGSDWRVAELLNEISTGTMVDRGVIRSYEIISATVPAEWATLTAAEKQRFQTLTGAGEVDSLNANVRSAFNAMFSSTSATRTALTALLTRPGSRAEIVVGQSVNLIDIAMARKST